ncbi:MAG: S8 family serine peptidase [bacterium]|nr:S8 family serine peptidase [bacterium]
MRRSSCLITMLTLLLFASFAFADQSTVIYLKWNQKLMPGLKDQVWRTQAVELDQVLQKYSLYGLRPAIRQHIGADPKGLGKVLRLDLVNGSDREKLLSELRKLSGTIYAVEAPQRYNCDVKGNPPDRHPDNVPTDPLYGEQWFYPVMSAPAAWDISRGSGSVVAIVDNGTDWQHPDLEANIWSNPGEIPGNNFDDDQNGFIDDVRGWDFVDNDNNPTPGSIDDYHGTHTAGLVGAVMNNGRGVVGMAPSCKVMPVRTGAGGYITNGLEGIVYAAYNGANVISLSWGGSEPNSFEQDVISDALLQGCVIVAAAGNDGNSALHYPAAYEGVMAVASTNPNDNLSSFSNRGSWITVCAPGQQILSLIPSGYGTAYGTSMSTPLVAGIAALVKSYYPDWTAQQIYNQIEFTADDITARYPILDGLVGTGRVNAFRALAETAPGIQLLNLSFTELTGNSNGKLDPGEQAQLFITLENTGQATNNVHVTLTSPNPEIVVQQGTWDFMQFWSGATVNNFAVPFQIYVQPGTQTNNEDTLTFTISTESFYSVALTGRLWITPSFADMDTGEVTFSITDFGAYGYYDYVQGYHIGSGFKFPKDSTSALYHGSIMAGVSPSRVSDCAYGNDYSENRFDWRALPTGGLKIYPGQLADQEGLGIFQDTRPPANEQVGLQVTQHSYAWADSADADYVIMAYSCKNVSGDSLKNLYVGLYLDWDLISYDQNTANWDNSSLLGYVYNSDTFSPNDRYYGSAILQGPPASYRVIDNVVNDPNALTDSLKYAFMTSGFNYTSNPTPTDLATMLSIGPLTLGNGDSTEVVFAIIGGWDLADLQASVTAAKIKWLGVNGLADQQPPLPEAGFSIEDVYPRPANGAFRISFKLPGSGEVRFDLVDVLGRSTPVWSGSYAQAGTYTAFISDWQGASGIYFLRGRSPYGQSLTKIAWMK